MQRRAPWQLALSVIGALAVGTGSAAPTAGTALPSLAARDVTGQPRELRDLIRGPTLLVAITDRDGGDAMRAWFDAGNTRAPRAARVSIISIGKPFFVSDDYARSKARREVPRGAWHTSLLDTDHSMANALGLEQGPVPYAFAIGGDGQVLATVHGPVADPRADEVWTALGRAAVAP